MKKLIVLGVCSVGQLALLCQPANAQLGGLLKEALQNENKGGDKNAGGYEEQSVVKEGAKGALVCGSVSTLLGGDKKTTLIAGGLCGIANAGYTALANKGAQEYAERYNEINGKILSAEKQLDDINDDIESANRKDEKYGEKIDKLIAEEDDNRKFIKKASSIREKLNDEIRETRQARISAEARLTVVDEELEEMNAMIAEYPDIEELKSTKTALLEQKEKYAAAIKESNGVEKKMASHVTEVDEQIIVRS